MYRSISRDRSMICMINELHNIDRYLSSCTYRSCWTKPNLNSGVQINIQLDWSRYRSIWRLINIAINKDCSIHPKIDLEMDRSSRAHHDYSLLLHRRSESTQKREYARTRSKNIEKREEQCRELHIDRSLSIGTLIDLKINRSLDQ
jgi:hypothetical protein